MIFRPGNELFSLLARIDMGTHHTDRTIIEHRENVRRIGARYPDYASRAGGTRSEQALVERCAIPRGMLFIEDDEIEAKQSEDLGILGGRHFHEGAEQRLASLKPFAKLAWMRTRFGHICLSWAKLKPASDNRPR
jgi:hypothetical protein